jgi:archaemetzincin
MNLGSRPNAFANFAALLLVIGGAAALVAYELVEPPAYATLDNSDLPPKFLKLVPLHTRLAEPRSGDWLDRHVELGQSYGEYVGRKPVRADELRGTLYVQPLGEFDATQQKILEQTAEFLGIYYQLPVRVREGLGASHIPDHAWRENPTTKAPQLLTGYVLNDLLKPRLPADAVVLIGLTASDLTPGDKWNFVFGQAMLADRVGVWSFHRLGDPNESEASYVRTLRRTLHLAAHETGHMFSIQHCIVYECCMCGVNHLGELDRRPLWLCPQCQAKVTYATGVDPAKQFAELIAFAREYGLESEAEFWLKSLATIKDP